MGNGVNMGQTQVLATFAKILRGEAADGGGVVAAAINATYLDQALRVALLPDEYEVGKYNVPVDAEIVDTESKPPEGGLEKGMVSYYRSPDTTHDTYTFWAPLSQDGNMTKLNDDLTQIIRNSLSLTQTGTGGNFSQEAQITESADLLAQLGTYLATVKQNVATIPDPLSQQSFASNGGPPPIPPGKLPPTADSKTMLATSWVTSNDPEYHQRGRDGYSVKFIPFRMLLTNPGYLTNTGGSPYWAPVIESLRGERTELLNLAH
jgi:hypothetical protein